MMRESQKLKIMFFANVPVHGVKESIGGATVLAKNILDFLEKDSRLEVKHYQIRKFWRNKLQLIDYLLWIFKFPLLAKRHDVISIHATKDLHFTIAPILYLWSKLLNKKVVYHFFGGNFHIQYQKMPSFIKGIYNKTILRSDIVVFETKALMGFFQNICKQTLWLPNSRKRKNAQIEQKKFSKRFVYISRVVPQKGVDEIVAVAEKLSEDYKVDIFGPLDSKYYKPTFFENKKVNYLGLIEPKDVMSTLENYDVILLPSYFEGEGYPGILIESLALGIPVITTEWRALPEIITNNYNGLLIPIKNQEKLYQAITFFNQENYTIFRENAFKSFENFDSEKVFDKLASIYLNLSK